MIRPQCDSIAFFPSVEVSGDYQVFDMLCPFKLSFVVSRNKKINQQLKDCSGQVFYTHTPRNYLRFGEMHHCGFSRIAKKRREP